MARRWQGLALLFTLRATMAFQFATVGALGPLVQERFAVDAAGLGLLIGLYVAPGIAVSLPGGLFGKRFGDVRVIGAGLCLMIAGGLLMSLSSGWGLQLAGRVLAGAGGVFLNVLMTKMVTDWFAGREIATAMASFVNAWPGGIALALVAQPMVAEAGGLVAAQALAVALSGAGLIWLLLQPLPEGPAQAGPVRAWPAGRGLAAILLAGCVWGLYNGGFALLLSFGPTLMVERGTALVEASRAVSLVFWVIAVFGVLGGALADRTGRPGLVLVGATLVQAGLLLVFASGGSSVALLLAIGVMVGLPSGPIMAMPARALAPAERSVGMGLFYTVYYLWFALIPPAAGAAIEVAGTAAAALVLGAGLLMTSLACAAGFEGVVQGVARPAPQAGSTR